MDLTKVKNDNKQIEIRKNEQIPEEKEFDLDYNIASKKIEEKEADFVEDKKKNEDQIIEAVNINMPEHYSANLEEGFNKEVALADIEAVLNEAQADTRRAALYYKVRDAIAVYKAETDRQKKDRLLFAVKESAENYLLEKRGNAERRKAVCKRIIEKITDYCTKTGLTDENRLDYLLTEAPISDKQLDMEILLATARAHKPSDPVTGNLKDRRKAFKRKIKDVRQVNLLREEIGKDTFAEDAMKDLYISEDIDDLEEDDMVTAKAHRIEKLLAQMLEWDVSEFRFNEPGDFVNRGTLTEPKTQHFVKLYGRLTLAEKLRTEVVKFRNNINISKALGSNTYREIDARLALYKEIKAEYDNRLDMMESPYYALLLQSDTSDYDTAEKRNRLVQDKPVPTTGFMKKAGQKFKGFISGIGKKLTRLFGRNKSGGEFTRGTDPVKLLKRHRKKINAPAEFNPSGLGGDVIALNNLIKMEDYLFKRQNKQEVNKANDAASVIDLDEEEEKKSQPQEINIRPQEIKEEKDQAQEENNKPQEIIEEKQEEQAPELKEENLEEQKEQAPEIKEEEDEEKLINELKDIHARVTRGAKEKAQALDDKEEARVKANIRETIEREEREAHERRVKELEDTRTKITAKSAERAREIDEKNDLSESAKRKLLLASMLEKYDALAQPGATLEEAFALKKSMIDTLIAISGVEIDVIEFTPTDVIMGFIYYAIYNYEKEDLRESLAERIRSVDQGYSDGEDDELLDVVAKLRKKGEAMTAQDRLMLYDRSALLIALNKNPESDDAERDPKKFAKLCHYDDLKAVDTDLLSRYARQSSDLFNQDIGPDESYSDFSVEELRDFTSVAKEILSEYTGKEAEFFDILPVEELSSYTYAIHDLFDKEAVKKTADTCIARAEELYKRAALIDEATAGFDRAKLSAAIEKLTGTKAEDLSGMLTVELFDTLSSFYAIISDEEAMKIGISNAIGLAAKTHNAEYYAAAYDEAFRDAMEQRDDGDEPDPRTLTVMREAGLRYIREYFGLAELSDEDYAGVETEQLFSFKNHADVILEYKKNPPADDTERDDLAMAIRTMAGFKLSTKAKSAYEAYLGVSFSNIPEVKALEGSKARQVSDGTLKKYNAERSFGRFTEKNAREMDEKRQVHWNREFAKKRDKDQSEKGSGGYDGHHYSTEATDVKNMIADLLTALPEADLDTETPARVKKVLMKNSLAFYHMIDKHRIKGQGFNWIFTELNAGANLQEKKFFSLCESSLEGMIKAIEANYKKKRGRYFSSADFERMCEKGVLDQAIADLTAKLPEIEKVLEEDVISTMEEGVRNVFGQEESTEEDIPNILQLYDIEKEVDELVQKNDEEKKASATTIKEMIKLNEKTEDQRKQEREKLNNMENEIRFDTKKGQGKFVQTLISNYYRDSSKKARRRMMSQIVRDMRVSKGPKTKDSEIGCGYFASAVRAAGPLMQKILQGVPERIVVSSMSNTINIVKSSLPSIDPDYVSEAFDRIKADSNGQIKSITGYKSLGAASVAETFVCTINYKDGKSEESVVKILRPDARSRMKEELDLVRRYAMYADMTDREIADYEKKYGKTYDRNNHEVKVTESGFLAQYSEIKKEFDFTKEVDNCELGQKHYVDRYYDKKTQKHKYRVRSVAISKKAPYKSNYFVMNKAEGETADKIIMKARSTRKRAIDTFENHNPFVAASHAVNKSNIQHFWTRRKAMYDQMIDAYWATNLISKLAYVWVDQAIFGKVSDKTNFHHGDLHAGNIMLNLKDKYSTVLDYGNAVSLKTEKVNAILNMTTSVVVNRSDCFVDAFDRMLKISEAEEAESPEKVGYQPMNDVVKAKYKARLDEIFKLGNAKDSGKKILVALNVAQELGIKLPKEIQNFSQCQQRLENTLMDARTETLKLCEGIDYLDKLPVADEDKDSFDPLIRFHVYRQEMLAYGKKDTVEHVDRFKKKYETLDLSEAVGEFNQVTCHKEASDMIKKYLPYYDDMKKAFDPNKSIQLAEELKEAFDRVYDLKSNNKDVPKEYYDALEQVKSKFLNLVLDNQFLSEMTSEYDFNAEVTSICTYREVNKEAFDRVYNMFRNRIPQTIEAGDKIIDIGWHISTKGMEDRETYNLREAALPIIQKAITSENMAKGGVESFVKALRTLDREEFEFRADRMIHINMGNEKLYSEYRKAQADLKEAQEKGDKEAIKKCRETLEKKESDFVLNTMEFSYQELEEIKNYYTNYENLNAIRGGDLLDDFSSVMGDCCTNNLGRTTWKLDLTLTLELNSARSLHKMQQEYMDAQEEALKKGGEDNIKKARELQVKYEKKLKEHMEKKKKKEEEIKKQALEAEEKEKEKAGGKKKSGWFFF